MEIMHTNRVIVLVDMDCFYCQVEENLNPLLIGKPIAVVQYNAWKGGGIIAVNYPARAKGVTRHMRGDEAKAKCPEIQLVSVPTLREKADLTKYRDAGKKVAEVLQTYTNLLERASVDEAYLDITESVNKRIEEGHPITEDQLKNTHVVGCDVHDFVDNLKYEHCSESNLILCMGGIIVEEIRAAVYDKTGYRCSAGVAHNKILAKLACGLHKPNQQTILPQDRIEQLFETLPLRKIRSLGGKFGSNLEEDLGIKTMGELKNFSEKDLTNRYDEKTGTWLYKIARGIDLEPVTTRLVSKSIGCCKKFPGRTALVNPEDVRHWINELSSELSERLHKDMEENNRKAKHMVVGFVQEIDRRDISNTRTHVLNSYEPEKIAADMSKVIDKHCLRSDGFYRIKYLGISAGKFEDSKKGYKNDISSYFQICDKATNTSPKVNPNTYDLSLLIAKMNETARLNKINEENLAVVDNDLKTKNEYLNTIRSDEAIGYSLNINDNMELNGKNLSHSKSNIKFFIESEEAKSNVTVSNQNIQNQLPTDEYNESSCSISSSVYSQDTVLLDVNEADLVYNLDFESTEGFYDCSATEKDEKDSDADSITEEIVKSCETQDDKPKEGTSSYFSSYFDNRNFDTSKHLEDDDSSFESVTSDTTENSIEIDELTSPTEDIEYEEPNLNKNDDKNHTTIECNENIDPNTASTSNDYHLNTNNFQYYSNIFDTNSNDDTKERCSECDKLILKVEMISHMDYHFALQMVRSEAHLYNNQNYVKSPDQSKKSTDIKSSKRKRCDPAPVKLTSFFEANKKVPSDTPTEICPECNKMVPTDKFVSHLDYHMAKKLHTEINPVMKSSTVPVSVLKTTSKHNVKNHPSIMTFFKHV